MNTTKPSKQPRPSFVEGKVRDPRIEEMQGEGIDQEGFIRLVKRAATYRVVPKPADVAIREGRA